MYYNVVGPGAMTSRARISNFTLWRKLWEDGNPDLPIIKKIFLEKIKYEDRSLKEVKIQDYFAYSIRVIRPGEIIFTGSHFYRVKSLEYESEDSQTDTNFLEEIFPNWASVNLFSYSRYPGFILDTTMLEEAIISPTIIASQIPNISCLLKKNINFQIYPTTEFTFL